MSGEFPRGFVELYEDFLVDNGSASSCLTENTTGTSASEDIHDKHGGWWRFASGGNDDEGISLAGELAWEVDEGYPLIFETRLFTDNAGKSSIFVGMNDAVNDTVVVMDEDGSVVATATDCVGFLLEGEQDETWGTIAVDSGTATSISYLTDATDAADDTIQTLRMELNPNDSGTAEFYIDGQLVGTRTSFFDSSIVYCPILSSDDRATSYNPTFDYLYVSAPRS